MQRKRFINKVIDGVVIPIPIRLWAGVTLVDAKDFTPKRARKGNYYVPVTNVSGNSVRYRKYMLVDKVNYKYQAGDAGTLPLLGHK